MKSYTVKFRYKDEQRVRTTYIHAVSVDMARNKVERQHNFQIFILECYEGDWNESKRTIIC